MVIIQIAAFAQRGKVRPEWDFDGGESVSRHSIDDDLWSFLLIIGLIVLYFVYIAIKGSLGHSKDIANNSKTGPDHDADNSKYCGEYVKMGYSSGMHIDEEILSEEDCTLIVNGNKCKKEERQNNGWTQFGEVFSLKDIWNLQYPDLYEKIDGSLADVVAIIFASGEESLRIKIPFMDGTFKELKLYDKTNLEEGDQVEISTIIGFEMRKKGFDPIIRFDGDLFYPTKVSTVEVDLAKKDKYGIKYSTDSKRLLYASPGIGTFSIREETTVICDKAFFMSKNIVSVVIPNGIRKIGDEAFAFCPNLRFVGIPNSVIEIGDGVFAGCDTLTVIQIPKGSTKKFEQLLPKYKDKFIEQD